MKHGAYRNGKREHGDMDNALTFMIREGTKSRQELMENMSRRRLLKRVFLRPVSENIM